MAFSATGILMVVPAADGGSDSNGGGFNPGSSGFATDLTTDTNTGNTSAPVVSSASYNFVAGDVGYRVFIKSGTNWIPGWYTIASVASNKATLTASIGSATRFNGTNAIGLNTAVGVASVGTPTSGTWGVDYSYKPGGGSTHYGDAKASGTDGATTGTNTQFTSASGAIGKNWVGNYINITAGASFTVQRLEIVSVSGTTATADKTFGGTSLSGGSWTFGGSLATPGQAAVSSAAPPGAHVSGNDVFIRQGTYTTSSGSSNVAGGTVATTTATVSNYTVWEGFGSIPKDLGTRPEFVRGTGSSLTLIALSGNFSILRNVVVDGASGTSITGVSSGGARNLIELVHVKNTTVAGITASQQTPYIRCTATGCSGTAAFGVSLGGAFGCEAYGNSTVGFTYASSTSIVNCISSGNTGASSDGFQGTSSFSSTLINCAAYGNGRHGFNATNNGAELFINCYSEGHASGYEFTATAGVNQAIQLLNCGAYPTGSGAVNTTQIPTPATNFQTLTGTAFTNAGSGDFSLNDTASQGALLRSAGFPGVMPRGTTTGYADIGAARHQDPAGGTSPVAARTLAMNIGTY